MQRSPPADRHGAPDKESVRRSWAIRDDPSTVTTESKVMNLSELKCRSARKRSLSQDELVVTISNLAEGRSRILAPLRCGASRCRRAA